MLQDDVETILNEALNKVLKGDNLLNYLQPYTFDCSNSITELPSNEEVIRLNPVNLKSVTRITADNPIKDPFLVRGYVTYEYAAMLASGDKDLIPFNLAPLLQGLLNEAAKRSTDVANGVAKVHFRFPSGKILRSMAEYAGFEIRLYVGNE